jgi:hypothetical protein
MSKIIARQLLGLEKSIEQAVGAETAHRVMEGSQQITETTKSAKIAAWVKGAMEQLDSLVDKTTRNQIMMNCGIQCALVNRNVIDKGRARRKKFPTEEAFLQAEQRHPPLGTRVRREKDALLQIYTPREYTRPLRCFCNLLRALPEDQTVSPTYCQCSRGFVQTYWEQVLEHPVQVELSGSCVSGATECTFAIRW